MRSRTRILARAVILLLAAAPCLAQRPPISRHAGREDSEARRYLVGEALLNTRIRGDLAELCEELGGRIGGTLGGRKAEDWAYLRLRGFGLAGPRFEDFRFPRWEAEHVEVRALKSDEGRDLQALALDGSAFTGGGRHLPLADGGLCGPEILETARGPWEGRAVLCTEGVTVEGRVVHRLEQMELLARVGAGALVRISNSPGALPRAGSVGLDGAAPLPAVSLSREDGAWLLNREEVASDPWRLFLRIEGSIRRARARNVVGEIPGENREEVILVGAHLDAWTLGSGAVDNGSGVGVLLETARLLGELHMEGWHPRRTVRFVLFMAEESGLHGSRAYVEAHRAELDGIRAMINLEMVGEPRGLLTHGHDEILPFLEAEARRLRGLGVEGAANRILLHSDHQPFLLEGVPTLSLLSGLSDVQRQAYHTAADTFDKLDFPALQRAAAVTAVLVYGLANEPTLPLRRYGRSETRALLRATGAAAVLEREGVSLP